MARFNPLDGLLSGRQAIAQSVFAFLLLAAGLFIGWSLPVLGQQPASPPGQKAGEKEDYVTLYLTEERVCKKCRWEKVDETRVRLINKKGQSAIYQVIDIIGYTRHPVLRKLYLQHLEGIGLPGRIIVPEAFEDEQYLHY